MRGLYACAQLWVLVRNYLHPLIALWVALAKGKLYRPLRVIMDSKKNN